MQRTREQARERVKSERVGGGPMTEIGGKTQILLCLFLFKVTEKSELSFCRRPLPSSGQEQLGLTEAVSTFNHLIFLTDAKTETRQNIRAYAEGRGEKRHN